MAWMVGVATIHAELRLEELMAQISGARAACSIVAGPSQSEYESSAQGALGQAAVCIGGLGEGVGAGDTQGEPAAVDEVHELFLTRSVGLGEDHFGGDAAAGFGSREQHGDGPSVVADGVQGRLTDDGCVQQGVGAAWHERVHLGGEVLVAVDGVGRAELAGQRVVGGADAGDDGGAAQTRQL